MMYYLHRLSDHFIGFNVFLYVTFRAIAAAVTAFLGTLIFGNFIIRKLTVLKLGQPIRGAAEVHRLAELHGGKQGTPTMGGVLVIGAVFVSSVIWARPDNRFVWLALFSMLYLGALGFTDGLVGLAIGCTITVAFAYALLSYAAGNFRIAEYLQVPFYSLAGELTVVCSALIGAGLGFLWFNCYPAKVFMGDTGSLAIGGMMGVVAICCKQELLLGVVGGVFVIEAVSVILQVMSFKLTGKRFFVMSPLHHHFELTGWKESTVIVRFWILSIIFALLGLATLKLR